MVPADILLLSTPSMSAFLDTSAITGEQQMKEKFVFGQKSINPNNFDIIKLQGRLVCLPAYAARLDHWVGLFFSEVPGKTAMPPIRANQDNLVLFGSVVRDTDYILGTVVYVGEDTMIQRSLDSSWMQQESTTTRKMYKCLNWYVLVLLLVSAALTAGSILFPKNWGKNQPALEG